MEILRETITSTQIFSYTESKEAEKHKEIMLQNGYAIENVIGYNDNILQVEYSKVLTDKKYK